MTGQVTTAWWDDPKALEAALVRYDEVKGRLKSVMPGVQRCFNRKEMVQVAKDFGLYRHGTFCFESETHMAVLIDYLIMFSRLYGSTPVERYLKTIDRATADEITRAVCDALATLRYAFLVVDDLRPGFGVVCHDVLLGSPVFLVDRSFSQTVHPGIFLAAAVLSVDNWIMTTGSALPVGEGSIETATDMLRDAFSDLKLPPELTVKLSPRDQAKLARLFIRVMLATNGLDRVQYA